MDALTTPPAYDATLADHGFDPIEVEGLTYPLGEYEPKYGEYFELMPGIGWTRTPVPGPLGHINNWILDDLHPDGTPGFAIVDTGLFMPAVIESWKALFETGLNGKTATKIVVTHFHPDHVGCAGWLANRFKAPLHMNRTEWLLARMLTADVSADVPQEAIDEWRFAGWDEALIKEKCEGGWGRFARAVSQMPIGHIRMDEGDSLTIGDNHWRVMIGRGHTPEHACLIDDKNQVMISGDQILPRITSNISVMLSEPTADPLGEWLTSIDRFRAEIDPDLLVLPAHGRPFKGAHQRLDTLALRHNEALDDLADALAEKPMRVVDSFPLLFSRPIGHDVIGMATGEAMATLRHLEYTGRAVHDMKDGTAWYSAP
ncbi:MBL fold metallo-hydrolase [Parasphingorhabdus cellanae]|uniref:MBL fold metallo-hydrolase n=1 Tax=Parasphingorhabdus cellanae TaxID=2806553 RepID=A0ABX7T794_9SPHN|nr:MBL fold metallo-hydrolase [Parasphingorhabdus cellanae]QTD56778.1 MBL fold metallo-hydrolase [Parasphingorhabdus cellanae]